MKIKFIFLLTLCLLANVSFAGEKEDCEKAAKAFLGKIPSDDSDAYEPDIKNFVSTTEAVKLNGLIGEKKNKSNYRTLLSIKKEYVNKFSLSKDQELSTKIDLIIGRNPDNDNTNFLPKKKRIAAHIAVALKRKACEKIKEGSGTDEGGTHGGKNTKFPEHSHELGTFEVISWILLLLLSLATLGLSVYTLFRLNNQQPVAENNDQSKLQELRDELKKAKSDLESYKNDVASQLRDINRKVDRMKSTPTIRPIIPKTKVQTPSKIHYAAHPGRGLFHSRKFSDKLIAKKTFYQIELINENTASYTLVSDRATLNIAFNLPDDLRPGVDLMGSGSPKAESIKEMVPGKLTREGNNWRIVSKIRLTY